MRLFRNNNLASLQPHLDKLKNNELTLEEILEEEDIMQDLKSNKNSQFSTLDPLGDLSDTDYQYSIIY